MPAYHNIEPAQFRRDGASYVGYGAGKVWRIHKLSRNEWEARERDGIRRIKGKTLKEISDNLL